MSSTRRDQYEQYSYANMSNLVTQANRRELPRRDNDPNGQPESLSGRINIREMGTRAQTSVGLKPRAARQTVREHKSSRKRHSQKYAHTSILDATASIEGLVYRPSTLENRAVYESLLSSVAMLLGDQSQDIVRSAGDSIIELLKQDVLKEFDKKNDIQQILGTDLPDNSYQQMVLLARKITDFGTNDDTFATDTEKLDDEAGVAVIIDDIEDNDSEEDEQNDDLEEGPNSDESDYEEVHIGVEDRFANDILLESDQKLRTDKEMVPVHTIDAFWLQRTIASHYPSHTDAHVTQEKTHTSITLLGSPISLGQLENDLMELFDFNKFELVQKLVKNREIIFWCTTLARAPDKDQKSTIAAEMRGKGIGWILDRLASDELDTIQSVQADALPIKAKKVDALLPSKIVNLDDLAFAQGSHLMSKRNVVLPEGSTKRSHASYEEVHVPPPKKASKDENDEVQINQLPDWMREAFTVPKLNRIQSKLSHVALGSDENLLLCAPTGAGKTNVAMLCILNELSKHRDPVSGRFRLNEFKIVYVAPLKALVSEMVGNFSARLAHYNIKVSELTGDSQLNKQQISETQIIVTTPEKWDIITRKATETSYTTLVRLLIIDEIHLLHDERGPVLESIVSRIHRRAEATGEVVRLVGLSATLPNYTDVATFLRVDQSKGLFYFDQSYRPCPLKQEFVGITEKKPIKRLQVMNNVCYEKTLESVVKNNQVLIFVHSRKETYKTAKFIRDKALENETIQRIIRSDAASREILTRESEAVKDAGLRELIPYGIALHHAGLNRADRTTAEELFAEGLVQVLVSTATLAWGVNLPAHTVIIKGTQIYSPEKGTWVELSPQDVLQMLGRAGRPQYDTFGEGIIITNHTEMQYYLGLLNEQLPIESQFVARLADNMNAEIVLGTVRSREDAVQWLGYTYLYVRMLRSPALYKVGAEYAQDEFLYQKRIDLVHSAGLLLQKCSLIQYNVQSGAFQSTELGRIASHYYVSHNSMATYSAHLKPSLTYIELFRIFALSEEFKYIPVREEEKLELAKLLERVPIPVKESPEETTCKINVLLQSYISRLKLDGFALVADMVYVTQSAGRILRSIFEICLKRNWSQVARLALDMCKMVEKGAWMTRSPLAQFKECPSELLRKIERKEFPWSRYFDLDPTELGELVGDSGSAKLLHRLVHQFPRLELQAKVQPITRSLLRVELTITPDFTWNDTIHGGSELFWIIAEDVDGEQILFHDQFILKKRYNQSDHFIDFTLPISEPLPPNYFVSLVSDRWLHAESKLAISFRHLVLPAKFPAPTPLLELQPMPISAIKEPSFASCYKHFESMNRIQTQVFNALYASDDSLFIGAPVGSGKTFCAEIALIRHWNQGTTGRAVYIAPTQDIVDQKYNDWKEKFWAAGAKIVCKLTGETSEDLKLLHKADLVLATPTQWDVLSRRWKQRKNVQTVSLFIADELHFIGGHIGPTYEIVVSRTRYIAAQMELPLRILGLSVPLANAVDLGEWIGASTIHSVYNFSSSDRVVPLQIHLQSFSIPHYPSLMIAMAKPTYLAITELNEHSNAIVFVPNRKQCRDTAGDLLLTSQASLTHSPFRGKEKFDLASVCGSMEDRDLAESALFGIGYVHEATLPGDRALLMHLFATGALRVLVASKECVYSLQCQAHLVVIMGTQMFEGKEHRYIDYPISDVLQMIGFARLSEQGSEPKAIVMLPAVRKDYYKKFLGEALPVESHLLSIVHDAFVSEISTSTIENKQDAVDWLTWTYFYRRLATNPAFYGLQNTAHEYVSEFLSDLVESTLNDLIEAKMIEVEDETDISVLNLGLIGAYYSISWITMQTFALSLTEKTKLKGLLEIVTSATEFEAIPIRRHEDLVLRRIYDRVPVKINVNLESPHHKAFILLQAHFSRIDLPADLRGDQNIILPTILTLLSACVDVMSSEGFINAINAMELSQMCVQAIWDRDSPLRQIPYFDADIIDRCRKQGIEDVSQIAELSESQRNEVLRLSSRQLGAVANFCNRYPDIEVSFEVVKPESIMSGEKAVLKVQLERDVDKDADIDTIVTAPFYPSSKFEQWWIVLTDQRQLLAIKKVTVQRILTIDLDYVPQNEGHQSFRLLLFSDSYAGLDQEQAIEIFVLPGDSMEE